MFIWNTDNLRYILGLSVLRNILGLSVLKMFYDLKN